jgi:hypothetical protein
MKKLNAVPPDNRFLTPHAVLCIAVESAVLAGTTKAKIEAREALGKNTFIVETRGISQAYYNILFAVMYLKFSARGYFAEELDTGDANNNERHLCHIRPFNFSHYRMFRIAIAIFNYLMLLVILGLLFVIGHRIVITF